LSFYSEKMLSQEKENTLSLRGTWWRGRVLVLFLLSSFIYLLQSHLMMTSRPLYTPHHCDQCSMFHSPNSSFFWDFFLLPFTTFSYVL
jgi:hypothetical protein